MPNTIYRNWNTGLGDTIATLSLLNHMQRHQNRVVYLSTQQHGQNLRAKQEEIMSLMLTHPGDKGIELVDEEPNTDLDGFAVWAALPFATKYQWRCTPSHAIITYHFDGLSSAADKNPSAADRSAIIAWILSKGYMPVELGPEAPLIRATILLASSAMFVGVCSGFAHLAHAAQVVPTYILEYQLPIITCHRNKPHVVCRGAGHFISQAENYLTFLRSIRVADQLPS